MVEKQGSNVLNVEKGQLHWFVCTVLLFGRCMYVARFNKFKSKPVTLLLISSCKPALRLIKHIQVTALLTEMVDWCTMVAQVFADVHIQVERALNWCNLKFMMYLRVKLKSTQKKAVPASDVWKHELFGCAYIYCFVGAVRSRNNRGQCRLLETLDRLSKNMPPIWNMNAHSLSRTLTRTEIECLTSSIWCCERKLAKCQLVGLENRIATNKTNI